MFFFQLHFQDLRSYLDHDRDLSNIKRTTPTPWPTRVHRRVFESRFSIVPVFVPGFQRDKGTRQIAFCSKQSRVGMFLCFFFLVFLNLKGTKRKYSLNNKNNIRHINTAK